MPGSTWRLPLSSIKEIVLIKAEDNSMYLGRSYDERAWESSPGAPSSIFHCCSQWCAVTLPLLADVASSASVKYKLMQVPTTLTFATAEQSTPASISRLLTQGTFGPTRATINALQAKLSISTITDPAEREASVFREWITTQMNLPPSLHREYWRKRVNPRIFRGLVLPTGANRATCAKGSRWQRYTFNQADKDVTIQAVLSSQGIFFLTVNGILRTVVEEAAFSLNPPAAKGSSTSFLICKNQPGHGVDLQEWVDGDLKLSSANDCSKTSVSIVTAKNPPIAFSPSTVPATLQIINAKEILLKVVEASWGRETKDDVVLEHVSATCKVGLEYIQIDAEDGTIYARDYRLEMVENTLSSPADNTISKSAMSGTCPSVPINFLNRKTCIRRPSCAPLVFQSKMFTLDRPTMRKMYKGSGKFIYSVAGLRLESSHDDAACKDGQRRRGNVESTCDPCKVTKSRWTRTPGACPSGTTTTVDAGTKSTIEKAIATAISRGDTNPHVIDIDLKTTADTDATACEDGASYGASVVSNGVCYKHVHPSLFSVVDATYWNLFHPGNLIDNRPGFMPIKAIAENGAGTEEMQTTLNYPSSHSMDRWRDAIRNQNIWEIGRLDDNIDFALLPTETQDVELGKVLGAVGNSVNDATHLACGSPGEVANDPSLGSQFGTKLVYGDVGITGRFDLAVDFHKTYGKNTVWNMQVLFADDQLRQRVAWSLSQVMVISTIGNLDIFEGQTEVWMAYYDIFVRHAFSNYHDIIKEVAYSPM